MAPAAVYPFRPRTPVPPAWPVERPCLAALKDLGLTDGQVAWYFRVNQDEVAVLRTSYGIAERIELVRSEPPRSRLFAWRRRT